jgi:hypothetical protein
MLVMRTLKQPGALGQDKTDELERLAFETVGTIERAKKASQKLRESMDQLRQTLAESELLVEKLHAHPK